jgi:hypothetical protein
MHHNVLRVGDVALSCACGKAILLTRCYGLGIFLFTSFLPIFLPYNTKFSLPDFSSFKINLCLHLIIQSLKYIIKIYPANSTVIFFTNDPFEKPTLYGLYD